MVGIISQTVSSEILRQQALSRDIVTLQQQVSSGNKYQVASENPQAWVQISSVGRQQALNESWTSNATYAQSRAAQAATNLGDVNTLLTRVNELVVTGTSTVAGSPGSIAVSQELIGIRDSISSLLNAKDYQGTPVFDDTNIVQVPVGQGLNVAAVGTRQSIENGIPSTDGTLKSVYDILTAAADSARNGDDAARQNSLTDVRAALDHVIVSQSEQGVRSERLDNEATRLASERLNLAERRSTLADTDLTEAISNLQAKLLTLQAAQQTFARVNSKSLFDYIG